MTDKDWPVLFRGALFEVRPYEPDGPQHQRPGTYGRYVICDAEGTQSLPTLFSTPFDANTVAERMEKEAAGQRRLF